MTTPTTDLSAARLEELASLGIEPDTRHVCITPEEFCVLIAMARRALEAERASAEYIARTDPLLDAAEKASDDDAIELAATRAQLAAAEAKVARLEEETRWILAADTLPAAGVSVVGAFADGVVSAHPVWVATDAHQERRFWMNAQQERLRIVRWRPWPHAPVDIAPPADPAPTSAKETAR